MRRHRRNREGPLPVDVFDTAAHELGFQLDANQQRAARVLATTRDDVYLWGPPGRGKSWLMATYFAALTTDRKRRVHFHEFFHELHSAVRRHRYDLTAALDGLLRDVEIVCFDEFHVHDPADGRFLARLLPALLDRKVRIVLTSNHRPHALMPNPLFHDTFLPTIDLIERRLTVIGVDGEVDYRSRSDHRSGFAAGRWLFPGTRDQELLAGLDRPGPGDRIVVPAAGRPVTARRASAEELWIAFTDICVRPTAPSDYLALARNHRRWVVDGVPDLESAGAEPAQRFANLVDVLHDLDVPTVFLADTPLRRLAVGSGMPVEVARMTSRLHELRHGEPVTDKEEPRTAAS
ncbi:cell division protein ZapE [Rhodococcus gannanensis]|uniref:Cell division protein ZapE n=1 Tax=Rhodococcus gannanensis TaxID=1960308 RepID=A0ABW4P5U7_9NOCA